MAGSSPTVLTLKKLRSEGWTPWIVEHWNSFAKIRQDLFGFGDILAFRLDNGDAMIIQCTTKSNVAARRKKIDNNAVGPTWSIYHRLQVWGWFKKAGRWCVDIWDLDGTHWQHCTENNNVLA